MFAINHVAMTFLVPELVTCNDSPCVHGTCGDSPSGYVCHCENGYKGIDCGNYVFTSSIFKLYVKKGESLFDNDMLFLMALLIDKT